MSDRGCLSSNKAQEAVAVFVEPVFVVAQRLCSRFIQQPALFIWVPIAGTTKVVNDRLVPRALGSCEVRSALSNEERSFMKKKIMSGKVATDAITRKQVSGTIV